jgi:hypothetical protein
LLSDYYFLCPIVEAISSHQEKIKIYNIKQYKEDSIYWLLVAYAKNELELTATTLTSSIVKLQMGSKTAIKVQGSCITVSKALLSARSPYFKDRIKHKLKARSFKVLGLYETIQCIVLYAQFEPSNIKWSEFDPCSSRKLTEDTLDQLINILHAANKFRMVDLFGKVQRHIILHGKSFIHPKNAQEIKNVANEVHAVFLERYCEVFIELNLKESFTLFPLLPTELRRNIWRQAASQPKVVSATEGGLSQRTASHIGDLLRASKESRDVAQQQAKQNQRLWGETNAYNNFEVDTFWLCVDYSIDADDLNFPTYFKEVRYCACPAPTVGQWNLGANWVFTLLKIVKHCLALKVLYLTTEILSNDDEFECCRDFTNREPTTLVEARNLIEERPHQSLRETLPNDWILPKIILRDQNEIKFQLRLS